MTIRAGHFPAIERELDSLLSSAGLKLFGIAGTPAAPALGDVAGAADAERDYDEWISRGMHGEMEYLKRNAPLKYRPEAVLPGCRSVIIVGCNYYQEPSPRDGSQADSPATGRVARYAWGRDYHNALGKRLRTAAARLRESYPADEFRAFTDASPLSERHFARAAGVGFTARNTLTISSAYGSWFFLGEILTTRRYEPTPETQSVHGACPSGCFRCGSVCPTGALYDHYRIDARRCISYLTIEHRGSIPEELRPLIGEWVFGCDLCQEVCPLNVRARVTEWTDFTQHRAGERLDLAVLLSIRDDAAYRARFAGTPLLRPGRDAMVRNACVAAGNSARRELLPALQALCGDPNAIVREHARWAVSRLSGRAGIRYTGQNAQEGCNEQNNTGAARRGDGESLRRREAD